MRILALLLLLAPLPSYATPAQVLLIRHGEKPDEGSDLSDRGWQRARALPQLFDHPEFKAFGAPVALFAQKPKADGSQIRPSQTLQFVAASLNLPLELDYPRDDVSGVAREILQNPAYEGKFVVLCWEHKAMEDIAAALGVSPKPSYPGDRFDRAWLVTFGAGAPRFDDLPERLLPGDSDQ